MERGPLLTIFESMIGTDEKLHICLMGEDDPVEIQSVVDISALQSSHGLKITTKQNTIWIDCSHVSAMWQARSDD